MSLNSPETRSAARLGFLGLALLGLCAGLSSCVRPAPSDQGGEAGPGSKPLVLASIFPDYDFLRQIAGGRIELKLLLPPGVEAHTFEPRPSDLAALSRAAMFVYTDREMEPWALDLAKGAGGAGLLIVEASQGIELIRSREGDEGAQRGKDEGLDPHIWLDPTLAARMVATIAAGLTKIDPAGAEVYAANAKAYEEKLLALDARISAGLAGAKTRTIVYGGHFAFGYFARRYGLDYLSPYPGFSPDAEPSPRALAELAATLGKSGAKVIFFEELVEPRVARVLAAETGARLELLHGLHNVSAEELASGRGYLEIMDDNLGKLRLALEAP